MSKKRFMRFSRASGSDRRKIQRLMRNAGRPRPVRRELEALAFIEK